MRAFLEPTESGQRLRLEARDGAAQLRNRLGVTGLVLGLVLLLLVIAGMSPVAVELAMLASLGVGAVALAPNALRLPGWAREREAQMESLAGRARALVGNGPPGAESGA